MHSHSFVSRFTTETLKISTVLLNPLRMVTLLHVMTTCRINLEISERKLRAVALFFSIFLCIFVNDKLTMLLNFAICMFREISEFDINVKRDL